MNQPRELSLLQAAEQIGSGALTAQELVSDCLGRIRQRDPEVKAWVSLHADEALRQARQRDEETARGQRRGLLHGLPFGIKDIFDVDGMETRAGTGAYTPHMAKQDAKCIARLRKSGAIFLGKTVTTAFALGDPGPTRNPWNLDHTPGGSSSGSGAAVADQMCLAALGTQTAGSVIRPASYNGVVGFKPTQGTISLDGVIPLSWQLDHVGTFTRSVADASILWQILGDRPDLPSVESETMEIPAHAPQKIWRVRGYFETEAEPDILAALDATCQILALQGAEIVEKPLPRFMADDMLAAHRMLMSSDAAVFHRSNYQRDPSRYPPRIGELIAEGLANHATDYSEALQEKKRLTLAMNKALNEVDMAIMPAATGAAPLGLDYTGHRLFNTLSSFCGLPVVCLPTGLSRQELPLGVQLLGARHRDRDLLAMGSWCEQWLPFEHMP